MRKLFKSLRFRLVALVLLGVIPALVITYISGMEQRRLAGLRELQDSFRFTRLIANYQESAADNTQHLLQYISAEPELNDPQACQPFLEKLHSIYPDYSSISVADRNGNIYCSSAATNTVVNVSDRDYFQQAVKEKKFSTGRITTGRLTQKDILPFALPVLDESQSIRAVLIASLDMDQLLSYAQQLNLPAQSAVLVVDNQGTILLRYPQSETWSGKQLPNVPVIHTILSSSGEGSTEAPGLDGIKRLFTFTPIHSDPSHNYFVAVGIPSAIAYTEPDRILRNTLLWISIAALLALIIAWFGGDLLFLRVVSLTAERDAAERNLREANTQLETRVQERTAELAQANQQLQNELVERQKMVEILHRSEGELNQLLGKLEQSNRDLEDFAYIASHDLQEPLRKVQAFGDRLLKYFRAELGEDGADYLNRMVSAAGRMQSMISDLLAYSRVSTKGQDFIPVDLNQTIDEVISDLQVRIQETGGQVRVNPLPTISADPLQMRQLFQNLIGNALKFHRPGTAPEIEVSAQIIQPDGEGSECKAEVMIQDNGIGFDEKYLDRIFQPFQRLHGREEYEGSGIGLAICRKVVQRHHGEITAASVPGDGSRFIITLPLDQNKPE